jgi:NADPH:quinone reductase-like Zn-dependent oxidoreductase
VQYDVILDIGGSSSLLRLRTSLTPAGIVVIIGGEQGGKATNGFGRQLRAPMLSAFGRR